MLCQNCQKNVANVHFTQILNSKKAELYLCEDCAKEKGQISFGSQLSLNDFFTGLIGFEHSNPYIKSTQLKQHSCEKCGMSYEEFQKTGKFGCSNCYEIFKDRLRPLLKRLHGGIEHNGKVPVKVSKKMMASNEIDELKNLLNRAVQTEEYEKAAELRDKIKVLENSEAVDG